MNVGFKKTQVALAVAAAIGGGALATISAPAVAAKTPGQYVAGDIHNHTTCSDGSISMQKLIKKATDTVDTPWGLDWFVQAGHGGSNGTNNCTLVEDATLGTPAYPYVAGQGPTTSWLASGATLKGHTYVDATGTHTDTSGTMYRWQTLQDYQYPVTEYLAALRNKPLFVGQESVVAGHEHSSLSVITGQMPASVYSQFCPVLRRTSPSATPMRWRNGRIALTRARPIPAAAGVRQQLGLHRARQLRHRLIQLERLREAPDRERPAPAVT